MAAYRLTKKATSYVLGKSTRTPPYTTANYYSNFIG